MIISEKNLGQKVKFEDIKVGELFIFNMLDSKGSNVPPKPNEYIIKKIDPIKINNDIYNSVIVDNFPSFHKEGRIEYIDTNPDYIGGFILIKVD